MGGRSRSSPTRKRLVSDEEKGEGRKEGRQTSINAVLVSVIHQLNSLDVIRPMTQVKLDTHPFGLVCG